MDIIRSQTFPDKKLRLGWEFLQVSEWSDHQNKINQRPVCHQGCSWAAVHRGVKKWKHWTGTLRTKRGNIPASAWSVCFYACNLQPSYSSFWLMDSRSSYSQNTRLQNAEALLMVLLSIKDGTRGSIPTNTFDSISSRVVPLSELRSRLSTK